MEEYGVFVELTPNLAGLAELREGGCPPRPGQSVAVYIKSIIPDRMKIKLVLIDTGGESAQPRAPKYFIDGRTSHISSWRYSPACASKLIESVFD